ncbi:hypothetical protein FIM25_04310 [Desulfobotulus mexicanus]|uniref:Uncharacterized protein n=2 Tax=Desulfobotulus mexicanus TaxID=2586642 RepID=A0A5Q4VH29_9BACT|nr:hypothetical protein FIM25_04310 [Desulfobotulus mexicanus]
METINHFDSDLDFKNKEEAEALTFKRKARMRTINRFVICTRGFSFEGCPPVLRKFLCLPFFFKLFGKLGIFHLKIAKGFLQVATFLFELSNFIFDQYQSPEKNKAPARRPPYKG